MATLLVAGSAAGASSEATLPCCVVALVVLAAAVWLLSNSPQRRLPRGADEEPTLHAGPSWGTTQPDTASTGAAMPTDEAFPEETPEPAADQGPRRAANAVPTAPPQVVPRPTTKPPVEIDFGRPTPPSAREFVGVDVPLADYLARASTQECGRVLRALGRAPALDAETREVLSYYCKYPDDEGVREAARHSLKRHGAYDGPDPEGR